MRHLAVRRSAVLFASTLVVGAVVFARLAGPERAPAPEEPSQTRSGSGAAGEALFARHCGSCHAAADLIPAFAALDEAGRREMVRFLDGHGSASPDEDRVIAEHLAGRAP